MKIGICTIVDYNNYGNRLQNFALSKILTKKGYDVETIKNFGLKKENFGIKIRKVLSIVKIKSYEKKINNLLRKKNFILFTRNNINESVDTFFGYNGNLNYLNSFDFFIIGSDQVWNYSFARFSEFDFLAKIDKPTMSYAASFGVDSIPNSYKKLYQDGLNSIDIISVREEKGREIVKDLTGRDAEVVLDPTLLLSTENWFELIKDRPSYKEKFVLTYFLDEPIDDVKTYIKYYASSNGLKIKSLGDKEDLKNWIAGPYEFVNLFSQAQVIFTDSFHACVFSIIFHKQFEIFDRNTSGRSMNSRLETLFGMLDLNDRWHRDNQCAVDKKIDYEKVDRLLNVKRKKSNEFLNRSLQKMEKLAREK